MRNRLRDILYIAAMAVVLMLVLLSIVALVARGANIQKELWFNTRLGVSGNFGVTYSQPGPTVAGGTVGDTLVLSLHASDGDMRIAFIDRDNDTLYDFSEVFSEPFGGPGISLWTLSLNTAGRYVYRDSANTTKNWGFIVVAPQGFWSWDPFFIFSFGLIYIVLPGYVVYNVYQGIRYYRARGKMRTKDADMWTKCVQDPNGPQRPTEKDVERYRSMGRR